MIDPKKLPEFEFEFVQDLQKTLGPIGVDLQIIYKDNTYYLQVKSNQFDDGYFLKYWGSSLERIVLWYTKPFVKDQSVSKMPDGRLEFRMGTIIDMLKDTGKNE
jgi:hypothetical protein